MTSTFQRAGWEKSRPEKQISLLKIFSDAQNHSFNVALDAVNPSLTHFRQVKTPCWLEARPEWKDKEYREEYLLASVEQGIAWQIRANRNGRNLSQNDLAGLLGTKQSAVSRMEDPEYGSHSLDTLTSLANVFDCALSIRFISFSELAHESEDLSPIALYAKSFHEELNAIENHEHSTVKIS